jgi:hypothetical protein
MIIHSLVFVRRVLFCTLSYFIRHIVPLKMDLTEGSETSAKLNLTPWRHPKEHIHDTLFRLYGRSLVVPGTGGYIAPISTRNYPLFPRVGDVVFAHFSTARMPICLFLIHFYCGAPWRYIPSVTGLDWGTQWLRHCATIRKVAGSNPDGVIGIFHWHNPSGRCMALELTQPLT